MTWILFPVFIDIHVRCAGSKVDFFLLVVVIEPHIIITSFTHFLVLKKKPRHFRDSIG